MKKFCGDFMRVIESRFCKLICHAKSLGEVCNKALVMLSAKREASKSANIESRFYDNTKKRYFAFATQKLSMTDSTSLMLSMTKLLSHGMRESTSPSMTESVALRQLSMTDSTSLILSMTNSMNNNTNTESRFYKFSRHAERSEASFNGRTRHAELLRSKGEASKGENEDSMESRFYDNTKKRYFAFASLKLSMTDSTSLMLSMTKLLSHGMTESTSQKVSITNSAKIILSMTKVVFLLFLLANIANANGFKIQEQSLNATALSSAYVAGARGADASYYNPANMGFLNDWGENKHEFEFDFSIINIPGFKFKVPSTNQGLSSKTYMEYNGGLPAIKNVIKACENFPVLKCPAGSSELIPGSVSMTHSEPDTQIVDGSTGDTNFMLPKFFYKSKNYSGFTFGASFIAPSGLAMKWNGKGGEFLQDVMIFLIEFAPALSYTYKDIFSVGVGWRILYGMGTFNNIVYVPLGTSQQQIETNNSGDNLPTNSHEFIYQVNPNYDPNDPNSQKIIAEKNPNYNPNSNIGKNCTAPFDSKILGDVPSSLLGNMAGMLETLRDNQAILKPGLSLIGINIPPNATDSDIIKAMVKTLQTCMVGTSQVIQQSNGSDLSFAGWRVGASVRVGKGGMFSIVYNSDVPMKFEGSVSATTVLGGALGNVVMTAPLYLYVTMPQILTIAYSHDFKLPNSANLRLEAVYERTFWSQGRKFDTEFGWDQAQFKADEGTVPASFSQQMLMGMVGLADFTAVKMGNGWVDTNTFRVGMTYLGKRLRLMVSAAYDNAPVPQTAIGIPDSDGYMIGVGAKYNFRGFDVGVGLSQTFKDSARSVYAGTGVGQLRIATFSIGYRW